MNKFIILLFIAISCSPAKMVQRQDIANSALKEKWISDWVIANPCIANTQLIIGKTDTVIESTIFTDTLYKNTVTTGILHDTLKITKTVNILLITVDTVMDHRSIDNLTKRMIVCNTELLTCQLTNEDLTHQLKNEKWQFWILLVTAFLILGLLIYKSILPKHFS